MSGVAARGGTALGAAIALSALGFYAAVCATPANATTASVPLAVAASSADTAARVLVNWRGGWGGPCWGCGGFGRFGGFERPFFFHRPFFADRDDRFFFRRFDRDDRFFFRRFDRDDRVFSRRFDRDRFFFGFGP